MPELPDYSCEELQRLIAEHKQAQADLEQQMKDLTAQLDAVVAAREAVRAQLRALRAAGDSLGVAVAEREQEDLARAHKALTDEFDRVCDRRLGVNRALEQLERAARAKNCQPAPATTTGWVKASQWIAGAIAAAAVVAVGAVALPEAVAKPEQPSTPVTTVTTPHRPPVKTASTRAIHKWFYVQVKAVDADGNIVKGATFGVETRAIALSMSPTAPLVPRAPDLTGQGDGTSLLTVDNGWQGAVTCSPPAGWVVWSEKPSWGELVADSNLMDSRGGLVDYHWDFNWTKVYEVVFQLRRRPPLAQPKATPPPPPTTVPQARSESAVPPASAPVPPTTAPTRTAPTTTAPATPPPTTAPTTTAPATPPTTPAPTTTTTNPPPPPTEAPPPPTDTPPPSDGSTGQQINTQVGPPTITTG